MVFNPIPRKSTSDSMLRMNDWGEPKYLSIELPSVDDLTKSNKDNNGGSSPKWLCSVPLIGGTI